MPQRYVYRVQREPPKVPRFDVTWDELLDQFLYSRRKQSEKYRYDLKNGLTRAHTALIAMGITHPYLMTARAAKTYRESPSANRKLVPPECRPGCGTDWPPSLAFFTPWLLSKTATIWFGLSIFEFVSPDKVRL